MFSIMHGATKTLLEVDFDALPEVSKQYIIAYGLKQKLNDCYAQHKADGADPETCLGISKNMLEALAQGDIGKRQSQSDPAEKELLEILKTVAKAKIAGLKTGKMTKADLVQALAKVLGKDEARILEHFSEKARESLAKKEAERKELLKDLEL